MFVPFWKVIPKFGIPGSIKIFNVLNAFTDFSLVSYSNVLVYMDYDDRLANLGLQFLEYRKSSTTLSCATRSIITWLIYLLRVFSPNRLGLIPSEVILVSCDPNIYPIMHSERIFSLNV